MTVSDLTLPLDDERFTPNQLAELCEAQLADLVPARNAEKDRDARDKLTLHIRTCRTLMTFAKARTGYR